jgi:hypothetical protein
VTNVPGPPIPIYSTGAELKKMFGLLCLFDGVALGHVLHSYRDEMNITFTACREAMPDPEFYAQCMNASFEEYRALINAPAPTKAAKRKPATKKKATAKNAAAKKSAKKAAPRRKPVGKARPATNGAAHKSNGSAAPDA